MIESENLLSLEEVTRTYGSDVKVHALREVSLNILSGDFMSIIGPSGSGKSTMLGLLGLLDIPTSGRVIVKDVESTGLGDVERSRLRGQTIGFVFQQFHLIPHLTALGNVETALLYRGLSVAERRQKAFESLEKVGLSERCDHRPVQLSGGEQQRVAIARAIVTDPLVVLADEPTGALDSENAENIMEIFAGLKSPERAVCLVTHDMEIADATDRRVSMKDGSIVEDLVREII
jgi:putative ABC transport system ATP-binding protein|tara:strand:+ start:64 stop:762 length:699 start_codon:yes stop_codon:yes gene_type:complete